MTGAEDGPLTRAERRLQALLWGHAALCAAFAVAYVTDRANDLGFIPNSVAKDVLLAALSVLAAAHVRRHGWLVLVLAVRDGSDLLLTSAHPQGGNALGAVVEADFRVRGMRNLFLCDASVFPSSVAVNPQLTVMGLAQLAARTILGPDLRPAVLVTQLPPLGRGDRRGAPA